MLKIIIFKQLLADLESNNKINLEGYITVRTPAEFEKKVKDIDGWWLIGVIPSSDMNEQSFDNITETDTVILYVLKPVNHKDIDPDADDTVDQETAQDIISSIKQRLYGIAGNCDHVLHPVVRQLDFSSMHTDPEYNFMGCDGYSLSFTLKTNWF